MEFEDDSILWNIAYFKTLILFLSGYLHPSIEDQEGVSLPIKFTAMKKILAKQFFVREHILQDLSNFLNILGCLKLHLLEDFSFPKKLNLALLTIAVLGCIIC